jgi:hypothetical protein
MTLPSEPCPPRWPLQPPATDGTPAHGFIAEGFFSIKDDGLEECREFCDEYHDSVNGVGETLATLLSGDGPHQKKAEYYMRTGLA